MHTTPITPMTGRVLVLLAGVFLSFGGLLVRLVEQADAWQFLFYRSISVAVLVVIAMQLLGQRFDHALRSAGRDAVIAGACLSVAFAGFILAVNLTTVANTLFMLSTAPFWAAILARLLLGERVRAAAWLCMSVAMLGVIVMVEDGLGSDDLRGQLIALLAAMGFAGFSVALRRGRHVDMRPGVCLAGLFAALVAAAVCLVGGAGLAVSWLDFGIAVGYGVVSLGAGLGLYTIGSRVVPAAELTLLSLSEVVLGPVWVWLLLGETPSGATLVGGALVLLAVVALVLVRSPRSALQTDQTG
ncbi:MAG: DMT family transporter [Gammaproteobacteria bacterium]|nr:DMT family transporter [Gammaproteobacteria bacterium]